MRPTGRTLIANARIGHATRTASLPSNGDPMAAGRKNTAYTAGNGYRCLSTISVPAIAHETRGVYTARA
jgi:hypothetical protein